MKRNAIWTICFGGDEERISGLQLVNKAYDLSRKKNVDSVAICIGEVDTDLFQQLTMNGADYIISANYSRHEKADIAEILKQMIQEYTPEMIMFNGNSMGKWLAAVCSTAFSAALTADCIDITLDDNGDYVFSRAALSNSVIARIKAIHTDIKMCTVKKNVFPNKEYEIKKEPEVINFDYEIQSSKSQIEVLSREEFSVMETDMDWQNSKIVFAVGRGVTSQTYLNHINELAKRYHATVVGTRAAVEVGMVDEKRQVGQSGYSICPDIYVGFGISGACQHIVGIKNAKRIIAINKDDKAPIFDFADYKIINSVESVIDEWITQ